MEKIKDNIMGSMTMKAVEDLEFTKMCYQETMRRDAPAAISELGSMTKDINVAGVDLRPSDAFIIATHFIQRDPLQWSDPTSFIPERFDPDSSYF